MAPVLNRAPVLPFLYFMAISLHEGASILPTGHSEENYSLEGLLTNVITIIIFLALFHWLFLQARRFKHSTASFAKSFIFLRERVSYLASGFSLVRFQSQQQGRIQNLQTKIQVNEGEQLISTSKSYKSSVVSEGNLNIIICNVSKFGPVIVNQIKQDLSHSTLL